MAASASPSEEASGDIAPQSDYGRSLAPGERREILVDMTNGDEVSITCGEAASIVDRIRGFFEPSSAAQTGVPADEGVPGIER